ncbi:CLUMA_CG010527, isoform A [Clunio marinus]|uniref:CLUMA_CG010527, isoform A n=1 Tax=Clunio marinus TaxID=568069 RepID=A0A1J1IBL3_9DIPT|nr:CLUMA_CG010527, isoform A [Clunio marinus]
MKSKQFKALVLTLTFLLVIARPMEVKHVVTHIKNCCAVLMSSSENGKNLLKETGINRRMKYEELFK